MSSNTLLIKPIPYSDESAASLLIRAADMNGFPNVFSLCRCQSTSHLESLESNITHQNKFRKLLKLLGLPEGYTSLAFRSNNSNQAQLRSYDKIHIANTFFRKDAQAFCPECLAECSYWRQHWLLRPYTICLKHHINIYDRCPKCQKKLKVSRNQIHFCNNCDQDLRQVPKKSVNIKFVQWFMEFIYTCNQETFNIFSDYWIALEKFDWRPTDIVDVDKHRLQMAYEYFTNPRKSQKTLSKIINKRISQAHPQIQAVYFRRQSKRLSEYIDSILLNCKEVNTLAPDHYQQHFNLAETCAILQISNFRLNNLIDKGVLSVTSSTKQSKIINSKHIEQILLTNTHQKHRKVTTVLCSKEKHLLDLPSIADRLMIHKEIVRDLGLKGWMKIETVKINGHMKKVATIKDFEVFNQNYIVVGTLAHILNVNSTNLAEKLKSYSVEPVGGPHIDGLKTTIFNKYDVTHITTEMITDLLKYDTNTGRSSKNRMKIFHYESDPKLYFSLKQAAKKLSLSPAKVSVLIRKDILKKDKNYHKAIMVEKSSIYTLIKELKRNDFISLQAAADQLNCAINWLHINWIRTGYVKLYDYVYWQYVTINDIKKIKVIKKEYLTAIEASAILQMHRTHIINLKSQGKIESISFGQSGSLNLYRRSDVIKLKKNA